MPLILLDDPPASVVPYRQKQLPEMSGPAVMQAILGCTRIGVANPPSQTTLLSEARAITLPSEPAGTWHVHPPAMAMVTWTHAPAAFENKFVIQYTGGIDSANKLLVDAITFTRIPAAVLVGGVENWVAVTGFQTDVDNRLQYVVVHDPNPPLANPLDPTHVPGSGIPNEIVSAAAWAERFRPLSIGGSSAPWRGRRVVVRGPTLSQVPDDEVVHLAERFTQQARGTGLALLSPEAVPDIARDVMAELGISSLPLYARHLSNTSTAEPILVQDLSRRCPYYLLEYRHGGNGTLAVAIDGYTGVLLSAGVLPGGTGLVRFSPQDVIENLMRGYWSPVVGGHVIPAREDIQIQGSLVWTAHTCSMLFPLYRVTVGRDLLLVSVTDGGIFPAEPTKPAPAGGKAES